jgi:signal transduction histidine kinase
LLSNAAKFSPAGAFVDIFAEVRAGRVHMFVKDCGPSIPESFRLRMFRKFSQAEAATTREKGGSGLGLFVSKLLVEQMGGNIGYDTQCGVGTVLRVSFPIVKAERMGAE